MSILQRAIILIVLATAPLVVGIVGERVIQNHNRPHIQYIGPPVRVTEAPYPEPYPYP